MNKENLIYGRLKFNQSSYFDSLGLSPIYALTPVSTFNEVSGSLENYLHAMDYSEAGTNIWIKPDDEKISQFKLVFSDFIAGHYESAQKNAIAVGYEIVKYTNTDVGANDIHYILQEVQTGSFSGGGTYVLFPAGKNAVLQTPHPKFDSNTAKQGIETYLSVRPRLLMLSGTRRDNSTAKSSCTDGRYFASDVAHQTKSLFYAAHQVVSDADTSTPFIQFHGFGSSTLTTLQTQCNSTNNKLINISEGVNYATSESENSLLHMLRRKVEAGGVIEACVYGNDTTSLGGTTNVEGRYTNQSSNSCDNNATTSTKRFIHLEQSYDVRAEHRADMANYINEALTEYLLKITNNEIFNFADSNELDQFDIFYTEGISIVDNTLRIEDALADNILHNAGILSKQSFSGNLDVILHYKDHALLNAGYQANLELLLSGEGYQWDTAQAEQAADDYVRVRNSLYRLSHK